MATRNYGLITSVDELAGFIDRVGDDVFGFDIETGYHGPDREKGSIHPETAVIVGISFTSSVNWARYVPLGHDESENLDNYQVARLFWVLLNTGNGVAHNAGFELRHLARWFREQLSADPDFGEQVRAAEGYFPVRSDTQVEAYLKADHQRFGLKILTMVMFDRQGRPVDPTEYLSRAEQIAGIRRVKDPAEQKRLLGEFDGHIMTELHELFPGLAQNRRKFLRFNTLETTAQVVDYACEDSVWCLAIHQLYYPQVKDELLYAVEMRIVREVVPFMEDEGICYDWPTMRRTADALRTFRDKFNAEIMADLSRQLGEPIAINLGSPLQVRKVLFDRLGLATSVYTDKTRDLPPDQRVMSTGDIALRKLAKQNDTVRKLLQWREMSKLLGTYLDRYETQFNYGTDGRAHPNHLSAFVITGRFAVSDPPYQGSPKKYHFDLAEAKAAHEQGLDPEPGTCFTFNFRDCIVAPPEHYILGFDLSQAELRAIAGEAQETALLDAFANGDDVHRLTASLMLGIALDEVTEEQRDIGKTMNFALLYGMGTKGLADRLGIPLEEAQSLMDKYFAGLPAIAAYMAKQVAFGQRNGYVVSRFGRRLPIWEYTDERRFMQQKGDRACVNYPIQGAATGDYMKIAMVRAITAIRDAGLSDHVKLVMNVHDALEFYVHVSHQPPEIINLLAPAVIFPIPGWPLMHADWHYAARWGSPKQLIHHDDGTVTLKGDKVEELAPEIEELDDGQTLELLPDVDLDLLRAVAGGGAR